MATVAPWLSTVFLVTTLASIGLPTLSNFVGEFLVLQGAAIANFQWAIYASLGVILSACYMLWMYQRVIYGEVNPEVRLARCATWTCASGRPWLRCIAMMVWMGVYSQSFLQPVSRVTARVLEQTQVNVPYRVRMRLGPRDAVPQVGSNGGRLQVPDSFGFSFTDAIRFLPEIILIVDGHAADGARPGDPQALVALRPHQPAGAGGGAWRRV